VVVSQVYWISENTQAAGFSNKLDFLSRAFRILISKCLSTLTPRCQATPIPRSPPNVAAANGFGPAWRSVV
jgi:hypothetical protein